MLLHSFINGNFIKENIKLNIQTLINASNLVEQYYYYPASEENIEMAIKSAKNGQIKWYKEYSPAQRGSVLRKAADLISKNRISIAEMETLDTGRVLTETKTNDVISAMDCLYYYAGVGPSIGGQMLDLPNSNWAYTKREPLGVTVGIGAWNYPLQSAVWKSAPALMFGNSMIFKPSELTPNTALYLAKIYHEAGLPPGVFNVLLGDGKVGEMLIKNDTISKISFTGSVSTGLKVYQEAAKNLVKVTMELGGKSPLIIFDDANLNDAVSATMLGNWYSNGQVCSNCTRVYVHDKIYDAFLDQLITRTKKMIIGNPMDEKSQIGPMITKSHMEKVLNYINIGINEDKASLIYGAEVIRPNHDGIADGSIENGYYLSPAIFVNCHDDMRIVKEEIFGMVLCILKFNDENDVIDRANNTEYGLSAGVFTNDIKRAHRVISHLKAGTTFINNYNLAPVETPWGGYKKSGIGRENGIAGIESWTQLKSVYVEMNNVECPYL